MFTFLFLVSLLVVFLLAFFLGSRRARAMPNYSKAGPSSLKMDIHNTTNYNLAELDPERVNKMSAAEIASLLEDIKARGEIPAYRDYYLLQRVLREKTSPPEGLTQK